MRHRTRLELVIIGIGILLMIIGVERDVLPLAGVGLALIGLSFLMWGTESLIQRKDVQHHRNDDTHRVYRTSSYSGSAAMLRGVLSISIGLIIVASGLIVLGGFQGIIRQLIDDEPGVIVVAIGIAMTAWLLPELIGSDEFRERNFLSKLIGRVIRLGALLFSIAIIVVGGLLIVNPIALDNLIEQLPPETTTLIREAQATFFATELPPSDS